MSARVIPTQYIYECDACGSNFVSEQKVDRPPHWCEFIIARDAYDWQGHAVADGTIKRLLCEPCGEVVSKAINGALSERRAQP